MIETEKVNISQYIQIVDAGRVAGSSPHRLHRRKCSLQLLVAKSWQQRSRSGAAWPEPPLPLSLSWPLASLGIPWHQLPHAIIIYHMLSWSSSQLVRNFQFQLQSDRSIYWQLPSICQCEKGYATLDWVNTTFLAASCFIVILESPEDVLKEPPRAVTCCTCEPNVPHEELNRILRLFLQLGVRKVIPLSATWIGNATAWAAAEKSISFPQHVLGDRIAACKDHNLDYGQIQEGKPLQCCSAWKLVSLWAQTWQVVLYIFCCTH